jgi:putative colanic acid biosynthesis glycosyltransferase
MRILQINSVANTGSTGRIAEEIGNVLISHGHDSHIAYGRGNVKSTSDLLKIGTKKDVYFHGLYTLLTDRHGWASKDATAKVLKRLDDLNPDLIALHNLHGYYLNLPLLFDWINTNNKPVVWTLFDCWALTGHCSYFDDINCEKWKIHCENCPKSRNYPSSWIDNSFKNFDEKRKLFTSVQNMEIVTHSKWLGDLVQNSFMAQYPVNITPSAINLDLFKPSPSNLQERYKLGSKKVLLGCASIWSNRKGYFDFIELSKLTDDNYQIVMIGLSWKELANLPDSIIGLNRTESIEELAQWYTLADVFVNPTSQDNFPTTNLEALACGTPVVTYNTGGSPEAIDASTGLVVQKGNIEGLYAAIQVLVSQNQKETSHDCRSRAERLYNKNTRYLDYLKIFERLTAK